VNPAIGVPDEVLGFFAYHYAATNMAVSFAKPEYALLDLNFPEGYSGDVIKRVLKDFAWECEKYGTKLVGGHTARYRGLEWPLASTTIIGKRIRRKESPENGDAILLVGEVGAETAWLMGKPIDPQNTYPTPSRAEAHQRPGSKTHARCI
jgi:hydrogenase maturation factor